MLRVLLQSACLCASSQFFLLLTCDALQEVFAKVEHACPPRRGAPSPSANRVLRLAFLNVGTGFVHALRLWEWWPSGSHVVRQDPHNAAHSTSWSDPGISGYVRVGVFRGHSRGLLHRGKLDTTTRGLLPLHLFALKLLVLRHTRTGRALFVPVGHTNR
jgi:hypothetical protein